MSLIFVSSKWAAGLWRNHVEHSPSARRLTRTGLTKQPQFPAFADDVHTSLYLKHLPPRVTQPTPPEWATSLLTQAAELPQWQALRRRVAQNGFASGVATESVLSSLLPLLPDTPPPDPSQGGAGGSPQPGTDAGPSDPAQAQALRKSLRQACTAASSAVDEAEASLDAMGEALGISAGKGLGSQQTLQDLTQVRELYALLSRNDLLKKIAQMAGRLRRLGEAHKKTRVSPAPGGITDVILGGDLALVLPAELAGLRSQSRLLKLRTLHKIVARQALQYVTQGIESETRGPLLLNIDESDSMTFHGGEAFSKAVAMTLLTLCAQQKRAAHLLGFTEEVTHEHTILPGALTLQIILEALLQKCDGGTSFEVPLKRSLDVLATFPVMKKADLVMITDGEASISEELMADILAVKKQTGLCVYVIGIGPTARRHIGVFAPIADETYLVSTNPQDEGALVAPLLSTLSK